MIQLYTWPTANGRKVHIMLEEIGAAYELRPVDIYAGDQHEPAFAEVTPIRKIPAIIDTDDRSGTEIRIFESGAILIYLAEKSGKLLPQSTSERFSVLKWLMFQMSAVGPNLGQAFHWRRYADSPVLPAIERYVGEARRIYRILDDQLARTTYIAGTDYSIADIAIYPWLETHQDQGIAIDDYPHVVEWRQRIGERSAVKRGMALLADRRHSGTLSAEQREALLRNETEARSCDLSLPKNG